MTSLECSEWFLCNSDKTNSILLPKNSNTGFFTPTSRLRNDETLLSGGVASCTMARFVGIELRFAVKMSATSWRYRKTLNFADNKNGKIADKTFAQKRFAFYQSTRNLDLQSLRVFHTDAAATSIHKTFSRSQHSSQSAGVTCLQASHPAMARKWWNNRSSQGTGEHTDYATEHCRR